MINLPFKTKEPNRLEQEIDTLFTKMQSMNPAGEEYDKVSDQLVKLYKLQEVDLKKRVSPDVLAGAATNIAGLLIVLQFENVHVITSKAFGLVGKIVR